MAGCTPLPRPVQRRDNVTAAQQATSVGCSASEPTSFRVAYLTRCGIALGSSLHLSRTNTRDRRSKVLHIALQGFSRFEVALSAVTIVGGAPSLLISSGGDEASRTASTPPGSRRGSSRRKEHLRSGGAARSRAAISRRTCPALLENTPGSTPVVADAHARYFGAEINDQSLTPGDNPRLGSIRFEDWLRHSAPRN